jgi:hypothetical protein
VDNGSFCSKYCATPVAPPISGAAWPKVYDISLRSDNNRKLYNSFIRAVRNRLYNTVMIYGLQAINIDEPQYLLVSVRLKFVVDGRADNIECSIKTIKKQPK